MEQKIDIKVIFRPFLNCKFTAKFSLGVTGMWDLPVALRSHPFDGSTDCQICWNRLVVWKPFSESPWSVFQCNGFQWFPVTSSGFLWLPMTLRDFQWKKIRNEARWVSVQPLKLATAGCYFLKVLARSAGLIMRTTEVVPQYYWVSKSH